MANYKVTYRFRNKKEEHSKVVLASSDKNAARDIERSGDDIIIVDVREDLPSWGDSLIGKLIKKIFKK